MAGSTRAVEKLSGRYVKALGLDPGVCVEVLRSNQALSSGLWVPRHEAIRFGLMLMGADSRSVGRGGRRCRWLGCQIV